MGTSEVHGVNVVRYTPGDTIPPQPLEESWIPHDAIREGAVLDFTLGENPGSWATSPGDAPTSACGPQVQRRP
jgi:putative alpha-1,2-mannosidase